VRCRACHKGIAAQSQLLRNVAVPRWFHLRRTAAQHADDLPVPVHVLRHPREPSYRGAPEFSPRYGLDSHVSRLALGGPSNPAAIRVIRESGRRRQLLPFKTCSYLDGSEVHKYTAP
jgi:hypothetical protein